VEPRSGAGYGPVVSTPRTNYVVRRPAEALRGLVQHYCGYHLEGHDPGVHVGLPSPYLTVVISLDEPLAMRIGDPHGHREVLPTVAGGLHARPVYITHNGTQVGIEAAVTPTGCRLLFGRPAAELAGSVRPLDAVLGRRGSELAERLAASSTWAARFAVLDDLLVSARTHRTHPRREIGHAWRRVVSARGAVSITDLARETGWSRRHLSAQFRDEFGLSPRTVARMARFDHAQRLLRSATAPPLGMVAALAGYADQAHMTREWHDFAGAPPTRWLRGEKFPFVQDGQTSMATQ
jgi:AraC-like DNA-binding protein